MNIFRSHYQKRDGALYKDLAGLSHKGRVDMLNRFIKNQIRLIEKDATIYRFNIYSIAYYQKLIRFCIKNKHIKKEIYDKH